jgi:sugar lactone lactonase YvrE
MNSTRLLLMVAVIASLSACGETRGFLRYEATGERQVWPQPPDAARYRYVGELTGDENIYLDEKPTIFTKIRRWLTGIEGAGRERLVLQRPQMGVVDEARGRIYVTDVSRQAVFVFDEPEGRIIVWDHAAKSLSFQSPVGIALVPSGDLLVVDSDLAAVYRINPAGEFVASFGEGVLKRPTGIARDPKTGKVYVSDTHAHNIKVFNDSGKLLEVIGQRGEGIGEFNFPTFLSFANNNLYVTDTLNSRVQVLSADGQYQFVFGRRGLYVGDLPRPKGVATDSDGNIYVVESYYDHLLVYSSDGQLLLPIGGTGNEVGQFYLPAGVWTDTKDRVYVADMFNGRVVIFEYLHVKN